MATAMGPGGNSRFTDLFDEPVDRLLSPIKGYEEKPLVPLNEAVKPISALFNEIEDNVYVALHNCQTPADRLTQEESAAIHLYTMEFQGGPSLYFLLNQSLRSENRDELKPWFSFLKLFLTALYKLPSQSKTIWRGIQGVDLSETYKTGTKFAWWGVSSCTIDIEVLKSNKFLGQHGERTLLSIECINGKSIGNHSYFQDKEKEIILIPGSYFEVIGQLNPAPQLHIIHLKEILPPITFVKPPFYKPVHINPLPPVVNKSNIFSQIVSKVISKRAVIETFSKEIRSKPNTNSKPFGVTIAGGHGDGTKLNQLSRPYGMFIDDDQTIYIADYLNDRIVEWKLNAENGRIVAGGTEKGNQSNRLVLPTDVIIDKENDFLIISDKQNRRIMQWSRQNNTNGQIIISNIDCWSLTMDKDGSLYVSDWKKNEVRRWKKGEKDGTIVAGGNGNGNDLNQLNSPSSIFVDEDYSLYVSDSDNHRVMKWLKDAKEGIVVAGGNGEGKSLRQLSNPFGMTVDHSGLIYVADYNNHRVMGWCEGAEEGAIVVGGNGEGNHPSQLSHPRALSFDQQGNLYVVDCWNNRIQKFEIN